MTFSAAQGVIAAMVTPALFILASASLIATVLVRLARVMDRIRKLSEAEMPLRMSGVRRYEQRAIVAIRALEFFFSAVAVFVVDGLSIAIDHAAAGTLLWLPIGLTVGGMALIVAGAAAMLVESRLAAAQIRIEIAAYISRSG